MGVGALRAVSDVVGQSTRSWRMLPSFLICGAQRAGTTSMYRTLQQHPDVLPATLRKGIHYFDLDPDRSLDWYRGRFPLRATARRAQRRTGRRVITGESSPYYLWHPLAPQRIAEALPGVRTLVLVRDPVERAYSAHAHEIARGFETEPFEVAIELEAKRLLGAEDRVRAGERDMAHQHQAYLARSRYVPQLERLAAAVGRDHVLVVDSGDFFADPAPVWATVCRFLGIPVVDSVTFEKHNARSRAPLDPGLRSELDDVFRVDDEGLQDWLGAVPSWRR
jgi:hypothetical protein